MGQSTLTKLFKNFDILLKWEHLQITSAFSFICVGGMLVTTELSHLGWDSLIGFLLLESRLVEFDLGKFHPCFEQITTTC
jgi:hypothetical protein